MKSIVRVVGLGFAADMTYEDKKLLEPEGKAIEGRHACNANEIGPVTGHHLVSGGALLECQNCGACLSFEEDMTYLHPPGLYQDGKTILTHVCTKCHEELGFCDIFGAEYNLCGACKTSKTPDGCVKTTFNLAAELYVFLKTLAEHRGITMTEAIHQCINTEKCLHEQQKNGCKVLLEHPDGTFTLLTFR